jgi:hypothetical protein
MISVTRSQADIQAHCAIEACGVTQLKTVTLMSQRLNLFRPTLSKEDVSKDKPMAMRDFS